MPSASLVSESHHDPMTEDFESMADTQRMETPHDAALALLHEHACELGGDEVRVLARIAERLKKRQAIDGPLGLESDRRHFRSKEARQEVENALVYLACTWLQYQEVT